jgi:membrane protein implicated in regulation of membrane protease activity
MQMDFGTPMLWWILAGLLVLAELLTGSFYLLMLAIGAVAGALAAHLGLGVTSQVVVAALLGAGATAAWHLKRARSPQSAPVELNRDANLDIGQSVHVSAWADDGTARVTYRGAGWTVRHVGQGRPQPGEYAIVSVSGNQLGVARQAP